MIARLRRLTSIAAATAVLTAVALTASAAFAAAPPGPETLVSYDFESAAAGRTFPSVTPYLVPDSAPDPTVRYWGRVNGVKAAGAWSLWCAGTTYPANSSTPLSQYVAGTRGSATVDLTGLADYYRPYMSFRYLMPTVGAKDEFNLIWTPVGETRRQKLLAVSSAWTTATIGLTGDQDVYLTRRAAEQVGVEFVDLQEDPTQTPTVGQGPAVDDFKILGYKYGPVLNLVPSSPVNGQVRLSWLAPYRAVGSTTPDNRAISYRVWRSEVNKNAWEELTSDASRAPGTSYTYTPTSTVAYDYQVQAWDTGTGAGRGELDLVESWPPKATNLTLGAPSAPAGGVFRAGVPFTVTGTLDSHTSDAVVYIDYRRVGANASNVATTLPAGATNYSTSVTIPTAGNWELRARHADSGHAETLSDPWRPVEVKLPLATLGVPSKPSTTVYMWTSFTAQGTISPTHAAAAPVEIQFSRDMNTITKYVSGSVAANSGTYSVGNVKFLAAGTWYIRARHADSSHDYSYSDWTKVVVSPSVSISAPKVPTSMSRNKTYTVYGTIKPRHTSTYLKVYAYKLVGTTYVAKKSFTVKMTTVGQPTDTSKYLASVKFTSSADKGYWRLKIRHGGHDGEATKYSSYSARFQVK